MKEIDVYEREVLKKALFPETYSQIVKECSFGEFIAGDCIRSLIRKKLLTPVVKDEKNGKFKRSFIYDSDHLLSCWFQATAEGIDYIEGLK